MTNVTQDEVFAHPEKNSDSTETRLQSIHYDYMDNLRALAMLLGIIFHAALAYSPMMHNLWLAADTRNHLVMDVVAWFLHLFRMPLFFLIAGFFALMLLERRGIKGFIRHRAMRIGLPFVIFLPLCLAAVVMSIGWAISSAEALSPMLQFIRLMQDNPEAPQPPFSTMHLWFLFNLMLFCLVFALLYKLKFLQSQITQKLVTPGLLLTLFPLLLVPALFTQHAPIPAPERIYPELWSFGFFGLFFLLGGMIYLRQEVVQELQRFTIPMLLCSLLLYGIFFDFLPQSITLEQAMVSLEGPANTTEQWLKALLEAYIALYMTLFCLSVGQTWLNYSNKWMRYLSRSSYWVYIIHLPILFILQFMLMDVQLNMWLKFLIGSLGTLFISLISYSLLVSWSPIGRLLNGKK